MLPQYIVVFRYGVEDAPKKYVGVTNEGVTKKHRGVDAVLAEVLKGRGNHLNPHWSYLQYWRKNPGPKQTGEQFVPEIIYLRIPEDAKKKEFVPSGLLTDKKYEKGDNPLHQIEMDYPYIPVYAGSKDALTRDTKYHVEPNGPWSDAELEHTQSFFTEYSILIAAFREYGNASGWERYAEYRPGVEYRPRREEQKKMPYMIFAGPIRNMEVKKHG